MLNLETGLPDLSVLGEGHYWEIKHDPVEDLYYLYIMREVEVAPSDLIEPAKSLIKNPEYRWWNGKPKKIEDPVEAVASSPEFKAVTVSHMLISRRLKFSELSGEAKRLMGSLWLSQGNTDESDLESLYDNEDFMDKFEGLSFSFDYLYDTNINDEVVLESASFLLGKVLEKIQKLKLKKELEERNMSYVGKYPPKKLGS